MLSVVIAMFYKAVAGEQTTEFFEDKYGQPYSEDQLQFHVSQDVQMYQLIIMIVILYNGYRILI